jgi:CHASE3 domain sensor protein
MYSLNMLWRLSLQTNDETTRAALERQIRDLEKQISDMTSGCRGL